MNKLTKVCELVLMDAVQATPEQLLDDAVLGFRPGRKTSEINFVISRLVGEAKATRTTLLAAKLDVNNAFDATDLNKTQTSAMTFVRPWRDASWASIKIGRLQLRIPGTTDNGEQTLRRVPRQRVEPSAFHVAEGGVGVRALDTTRAEGWGIHASGTRLMRMTWADDDTLVARDAKTLTRMWNEAARLINDTGSTIDMDDTDK